MPVDNDTLLRLLTTLDQKQDARSDKQDQRHVELISAISKLDTQMESVLGGKQPGRMQSVEEKADVLMRFRYKLLGIATLVSAAASAAMSVVLHLWKMK